MALLAIVLDFHVAFDQLTGRHHGLNSLRADRRRHPQRAGSQYAKQARTTANAAEGAKEG
jgi:hypothetical protein